MSVRDLCLVEPRLRGDEATRELVDRYVGFVAARCRPNTVAATRSDLGVFFSVVDKPPVEVTASDVLEFIAAQRRPRGDGKVVRLADGEAGLPARTIKRRVATVSGFFAWLTIIGAVSATPVPRGLSTRRRGRRSGVPLVRTPRTLPKVLDPGEVNALLGALRQWRDRAMVEAMVLGGLRRVHSVLRWR
jgi:integrase/recombinase XerD